MASPLYTLQGMVFNLGVAKRYGMWAALTEAAEPPFGCIMEAWVLWTGLAGLLACVFLRVYRNHSVLVRHDGFMWALPLQLATLMIPFLVPPVFITVNANTTVAFDEDTQECERQSDTLEAFTIAAVSILTIAVVALTFRLRAVKLQVRRCSNFFSLEKRRGFATCWHCKEARSCTCLDCCLS